MHLGEPNGGLFGTVKITGGIRCQQSRLKTNLVYGGDAGLVQPGAEISGVVVHPERRRRRRRRISARSQHEGRMFVFQQAEITGLRFTYTT